MQEQKEKEMSESARQIQSESESEKASGTGHGRFILGIPCKYSEITIIPKHIYEFFDWGETAKCRGGELVTLELVEEYASTEQINADLSAMYGMGIEEYTSRWKQRLDALNSREIEWVKVKMRKIEKA